MISFTPIRVTAMYRAQRARGATFKSEAAWKVADVYTSADDEVRAARRGVGFSDTSASGKFGIRGEAIEPLLATLMGPTSPVAPDRVVRVALDGAPVLLGRVAPDEVLILTRATDAEGVVSVLVEASERVGCAHVMDFTSALAAVDLVGPRVPSLLARVLPLDLSALGPLALLHAECSRVRVTLIRLDHPTLPAYRLLVAREYGEFLWHTLGEVGHDLGLAPIGAAAHERLLAAM